MPLCHTLLCWWKSVLICKQDLSLKMGYFQVGKKKVSDYLPQPDSGAVTVKGLC